MASALYVKLVSRLEDLNDRYNSLLQEFRETGDDELFIDLDADLIMLGDEASKLTNLEERYDITHDVTILRSLIRDLPHSAV